TKPAACPTDQSVQPEVSWEALSLFFGTCGLLSCQLADLLCPTEPEAVEPELMESGLTESRLTEFGPTAFESTKPAPAQAFSGKRLHRFQPSSPGEDCP